MISRTRFLNSWAIQMLRRACPFIFEPSKRLRPTSFFQEDVLSFSNDPNVKSGSSVYFGIIQTLSRVRPFIVESSKR